MNTQAEKNMDDSHPGESFFLRSPSLIIFFIAFTVFVSEAIVMLLLSSLHIESTLIEGLVDPALLVLFISPALFFFVFQPILIHVRERKRIEDILQKNMEEQFKAMILTSLDGFWMADIHGRLLEVNDAFCRLMGYSREELLSMGVSDVEVIETPEDASRHISELIGKGRVRFETSYRRKDGSFVNVEVSINYSKIGDERIYCFLRDMTERQKHEAELLAARQKEEVRRLKSAFLMNLSHEFRTPLNAILGFGQLLDADTDLNTADRQESVKHILESGHLLLGLINDLLSFSQFEAGKMNFNIQPLCIADITSSCVAQVATAMGSNKNILIRNTITDTALRVQGDNQRVRQVLINLLSNAVKYNKEYGQITVSSAIEQGGWLRIEVRDTGVGIAREKMPLLFTPFERIDQSHGSISGVGIGLHITKLLVEEMHGTVGAESEQGKGSTFWFELPLAEETDEPAEAPGTSNKPMLHGDTRFVVLCVEDNPASAKLVQTALKSRPGIQLLMAGTAEEGLKIAEESLPDLILMDIHLPRIDGITATTILKEIEATRDIPVVALSAAVQREDIERALIAGCSTYLTKPIELQALYEVIDSLRQTK
jgi:PAS domain S-box-containing protein